MQNYCEGSQRLCFIAIYTLFILEGLEDHVKLIKVFYNDGFRRLSIFILLVGREGGMEGGRDGGKKERLREGGRKAEREQGKE